jgi:soluble epoxide hydrolase/lipid-phosphate phosphatase
LQKWLAEDKTTPSAEFVDEEMKTELLKRWREDGFAAKLGWYKAMTTNAQWEHEQHIPASAFKLSIPVLFLGGSRDAPAPAVLGELATKPLCADFTSVVIDSGHWMLREKSDDWLDAVTKWLTSKF